MQRWWSCRCRPRRPPSRSQTAPRLPIPLKLVSSGHLSFDAGVQLYTGPGSAPGCSISLELGCLAREERRHPPAQVLRRHAVGDPVALELQMVVDRVLDALVQQPLGRSDVVGGFGCELLGLLRGAREQLVRRYPLADQPRLESRV